MMLRGTAALVTGGSRGIGAAIARRLIAEGSSVAVAYQKEASLATKIAKSDPRGKSFAVALNVCSRASIRRARAVLQKRFGTLDILVNNAGINRPNDFDKISEEDWAAVLDTNLGGPFRVTQEFLPVMRDGGAIVMISSVSGQYGGPRTTHYAASKAGLVALTENLAIFCASRNIRVNAVSPGLIETPMAAAAKNLGIADKVLLKRMGTPDEVAAVVAFLASRDASYITAQTLNVNGGLYF